MITSSPQLRSELEVIRGMDDIPLIYDPVTGSYHRISRAGEVVLSYLDGTRTRDDLVARFAGRDAARSVQFTRQLDSFLARLEESGLLVGTAPPQGATAQRRFRTSMLMPRVVLTRSLPTVLEPLARVVRALPLRLASLIAALGALVGYGFGFHTLLAATPPLSQLAGPAYLAAAGVMLLLVLVHETAHALVAQVLKAPVRGLGVALLFYFMPVAYVDRTDAYRLRQRSGRVALALAGIVSDGWLCGLTGVVALHSAGFLRHTAACLLAMQALLLLINVNPLLPSDGYTAIEAATGLTNARGRAFALLRSVVARRPLPNYLENLGTRARLTYLAYALLSTVYVCFLAFSALRAIPVSVHLARSVVGR